MTVLQAVAWADDRRPNSYSLEEKLRWLSQLDGKVSKLLLEEYGQQHAFSGYSTETPPDTQLLIGPPFEEIYLYWLEAQIGYADGETGDYNGAIAQYNRLYEAFANAFRRSHVHRLSANRFVF